MTDRCATAPADEARVREVPPSRTEPVRVALIDDHPVVLAGIESWYAASDRPIEVRGKGPDVSVATAGPGRAAEVVVFDLQLSSGSPAYSALRHLVAEERQVIVYTMQDSQEAALRCLDLGAVSYLTKAEGERHLVAATLAAADGVPYTPPALAGALGSDVTSGRPTLTPREIDVLLEWFQSESKVMVGESLGISVRTVNTYLERVRIKYANVGRPATTKANLVAKAIQDGLISLEEL
ncbi:two component transcriptional regulator, LuxR family [Streptomyces zhaozhouensis]|uniref:Two component transcriptional regulator, LuxR family n=1 Tax=Streptomyces zhaozhouensis TaxID=1300267 RepID=A0A286DN97_9ACTN|nr:response regulator transcription factor [Streptomyces zhaozhouensis]SOD60101.1 two component transcriptional regulator, LuxR family [Streptomyces zhaozhouensis]